MKTDSISRLVYQSASGALPGNDVRLDFSSYQAVSGSSVIVFEMISLPIDNAALMRMI
jgi:hypothetical protein